MSKKILLIGSPNAGKSSLFNLLTGLDRKVSNYSGITVDSGQGFIRGLDVEVVDLPGIHSFIPASSDEAVTIETLFGMNPSIQDFFHICLIADFSRIENSLYILSQLKQYFPLEQMTLIVNKVDLLNEQDGFDWDFFSRQVGVNVHKVSTLENPEISKTNLKQFFLNLKKDVNLVPLKKLILPEYSKEQLVWNFQDQVNFSPISKQEIAETTKQAINDIRVWLPKIYSGKKVKRSQLTSQFDKIVLHPFWGALIFIFVFYFIFHALYSWSAPLMEIIDQAIVNLGNAITQNLADGDLKSLLQDGVFAGVGGVIVFLPQILILFFLLNLLEQSGYIARAAVLTDKLLAKFGLNGKAFLPFLSGFACSVPAIMSTRTIADRRERMATLLVIPLITCSARLPVYVLLIGTFIPEKTVAGVFNSKALAFFFMYFLGSVVALIFAKIFRLTFFKGKTKSFVIELPIYQIPKLKYAFKQSMRQGMVFLKKAGTTIFALSILIWFLSSYPKIDLTQQNSLGEDSIRALQLENSYIGKLGKGIEPLIRPLGYDWKIGVGLIVAFGARELFVSGLGTIYALGDVSEESQSLKDHLLHDPQFNFAVACSLLIFFAFACQCMSTLAIVKKETQSNRWPILMFFYMSIFAYIMAFFTYRILV